MKILNNPLPLLKISDTTISQLLSTAGHACTFSLMNMFHSKEHRNTLPPSSPLLKIQNLLKYSRFRKKRNWKELFIFLNLVFPGSSSRSCLILTQPQVLDPLLKFKSAFKGRDSKEILKGPNFIVKEGSLWDICNSSALWHWGGEFFPVNQNDFMVIKAPGSALVPQAPVGLEMSGNW